jgi:hypothetical protein
VYIVHTVLFRAHHLKRSDHRHLEALAQDRNTAHKHVWRTEIARLSDG